MKEKTAYFAGGCFWCITPHFRDAGARKVISGYSGGTEENPGYADVKHQLTGHRETVAVTYDEETIDYAALLKIFLENVDPFDGEGQFIDRGRSYTLAVYYTDEKEKTLAEEAVQKLQRESGKPVFVSVEPFRSFYRAEEYHQDYDLKNPEAFKRELVESGRLKVLK